MIYKIVVDKQPMTNPSGEKKEYEIDIDELHFKRGVYDSLVITHDEDYVIRRLELGEYNVLTELNPPIKEPLPDLNIELFEGDNYIYLYDMTGNRIVAQYLVKNDFNELYVIHSEMNSAIEQSTKVIELSVKKKLAGYSTTEEMNSAISLKANEITSTVSEKVDKTEVGTYIQQNTEAIKVAWNQISEFIQMMILNNNASFAILDENKNLLMSLDKEGQHFYKDDGTKFGEMGVQTVDYNNYIAFAVPTDYDTRINDGMAWGVTTSSDGKFHPILYIKNFTMPAKNSGGCTGEMLLSGCDLVLDAEGSGIVSNGVKMQGDAIPGIFFLDKDTNSMLLSITPENGIFHASINMLDNISFYRNQAGSNSFKIGNDNNAYCLFTDEGSIHCSNIIISDGSNLVSIHPNGEVIGNDLNFDGLPSYQGKKLVYGQNGHWYYLDWTGSRLNFWVDTTNVATLSDKRLKTEIQDIDEDFIKAIEEVEMKQFKVANRNGLISFGILAQDLIEIFKKYNKNPFDYEIVYKTQFRIDDDTIYYAINYEQFLILKQKAMDKKIEELQEKDKQKDAIISDLISRLEKLEKEANNGQD